MGILPPCKITNQKTTDAQEGSRSEDAFFFFFFALGPLDKNHSSHPLDQGQASPRTLRATLILNGLPLSWHHLEHTGRGRWRWQRGWLGLVGSGHVGCWPAPNPRPLQCSGRRLIRGSLEGRPLAIEDQTPSPGQRAPQPDIDWLAGCSGPGARHQIQSCPRDPFLGFWPPLAL